MSTQPGIDSIGACCGIKVYRGINYTSWDFEEFCKAVRAGKFQYNKMYLFSPVYGRNAGGHLRVNNEIITGYEIEKKKRVINKRVNQICDFVLNNGLGEIYTLPKFQNGDSDGATVAPFVWITCKEGMKALWAKEEWRAVTT